MFGDIVHYHRKKAGLSRKALSELTGVSSSAIYNIEHNKATLQWNIIQSVLHALNIKIVLNSPLMKEYEKSKDHS